MLKATLISSLTPNLSKYGPASGEQQLFPCRRTPDAVVTFASACSQPIGSQTRSASDTD
jgi:hypothetical protein